MENATPDATKTEPLMDSKVASGMKALLTVKRNQKIYKIVNVPYEKFEQMIDIGKLFGIGRTVVSMNGQTICYECSMDNDAMFEGLIEWGSYINFSPERPDEIFTQRKINEKYRRHLEELGIELPDAAFKKMEPCLVCGTFYEKLLMNVFCLKCEDKMDTWFKVDTTDGYRVCMRPSSFPVRYFRLFYMSRSTGDPRDFTLFHAQIHGFCRVKMTHLELEKMLEADPTEYMTFEIPKE